MLVIGERDNDGIQSVDLEHAAPIGKRLKILADDLFGL